MKNQSKNERIKNNACDFEIATCFKVERLALQNIYELTITIDAILPQESEKRLDQLCEKVSESLMNDSRASLTQLAREIESSALPTIDFDRKVISQAVQKTICDITPKGANS